MSSKNKHQKSLEEYRRDIYALKAKLKTEQQYLIELRQKCADLQILTEKSYSFSMKLKILEYTLNDIRAKLLKIASQQAFQYYRLNYATFALIKSCEIIGLSRQMIFRGIDTENKGEVGWFEFSNFLREVMRLDSEFINPIMKVLCPDESKPVTKQRYDFFLSCFLIKTEQNGEQINNLNDSIDRVALQLSKQKIDPKNIWKQKQINVATTVYALINKVNFLDILDCIACYCKCDPLKTGVINSSAVVNLLQHSIQNQINFTKIKLKK